MCQWHSDHKSTTVTPYACPFFSCYLLPLKPFAYGTAAAIRFIWQSAYTLYDGRQQGVRQAWYDEQNDVKGWGKGNWCVAFSVLWHRVYAIDVQFEIRNYSLLTILRTFDV